MKLIVNKMTGADRAVDYVLLEILRTHDIADS